MPNDPKLVLADSNAAHTQLVTTDAALQKQINTLDDIEWKRPLTDQERTQRESLRSAQAANRAAMVELSYITLSALDQSAEVQRILNAFQSINADLKKAANEVKTIEQVAATMAQALAAAEKVAETLAKFAA